MNEEEKEAIECLEMVLDNETDIETEDLTNKCINNILNLIKKQWKEIQELKLFKEEVIDIIKYADDTAEPTYWNIRKLLGLGE